MNMHAHKLKSNRCSNPDFRKQRTPRNFANQPIQSHKISLKLARENEETCPEVLIKCRQKKQARLARNRVHQKRNSKALNNPITPSWNFYLPRAIQGSRASREASRARKMELRLVRGRRTADGGSNGREAGGECRFRREEEGGSSRGGDGIGFRVWACLVGGINTSRFYSGYNPLHQTTHAPKQEERENREQHPRPSRPQWPVCSCLFEKPKTLFLYSPQNSKY